MKFFRISQRGKETNTINLHQVHFDSDTDGVRANIEVVNVKTIKGARAAAEKFAKKYAKENGFKKYKFMF